MEHKFLQQLLQAGLLDIGDKDERLENIVSSIEDLEKKLLSEETLLVTGTLVAIDPNVDADDPVMQVAEEIVANHWKALRGKFADRPVTLLRAVLLHALYNAGIKDARVARIIYLTATNFYPYAKLGQEKKIVAQILEELGELAEQAAVEEWSLGDSEPSLKLPPLKISNFKLGKAEVSKPELRDGLRTAIGQSAQGLNSNNGGHNAWGDHFADQSSEAISAAFNGALSRFSESLSPESLENPLNKFFTEFKKALDAELKSVFQSVHAVELRSKLLWWKETLYSASLKDSYRTVPALIQPVVMAYDLYQQLPDTTPASVDYLLRDTLLLLSPSAAEKVSFQTLLEQYALPENKKLLKGCLAEIDMTPNRMSITDFLTLFAHGKAEATALEAHTGIDPNEQVSLTDLSVMILHDLLADALTETN